MSTIENEKARVEARADVAGRTVPGRFEGYLARALAGLTATYRARAEHRRDKATEGDRPKPHGS